MRKRKRQILNFLAEVGKISAALLFPKNLSFGKYKIARSFRLLLGADTIKDKKEIYRRKKSIYVLLYRLKRDGFVVRTKKADGDVWRLTEEGRELLATHHEKEKLPVDGRIRLCIFDIPEFEKRKRNWLRSSLRAYGYEPLQKSVWWSNRPLPEEFIEEIGEKELTEYIHIFGVGERGTLQEAKMRGEK